jgi:peptide/nickel transport system permease protein
LEVNFELSDFKPLTPGELRQVRLRMAFRRFREAWSIFSRNRLALLGLGMLVVFFLMAVLHPILMKTIWPKTIYDPVVGHDLMIFPHPSLPSRAHLLGTDTLGRDVLSVLMAATAPSLQMAFTATLTAALVGTLVGAFSAYFRGFLDWIFSHLADLTLLAPAPLVMVVIGFILDISPFEFGLIYGLLAGVGVMAVVLRAHAATVVSRSFIDAAKVSGGDPFHIVTQHLIPHIVPLAAVNMLFTVTGAIFAMGFVAFLGLSRAQLNWGSMIYDSFTYQQINGVIAWNVLIPSALAISLFAASFYLIALGMEDVVNPRSSGREAADQRARAHKEIKTEPLSPPVQEMVLETIAQETLPATVSPESIEAADAHAILEPSPIAPPALAAAAGGAGRVPITILMISLLETNEPAGCDHDQAETPGLPLVLAEIVEQLERSNIPVQLLNDGSIIATFGWKSYMPARAGTFLAIRIGVGLREFVKSRCAEGGARIQARIGIAGGSFSTELDESLGWVAAALASSAGMVARSLEELACQGDQGQILIDEVAFRRLTPIRHHFQIEEKGQTRLPGTQEDGAVFQVLGFSEKGKEIDLLEE